MNVKFQAQLKRLSDAQSPIAKAFTGVLLVVLSWHVAEGIWLFITPTDDPIVGSFVRAHPMASPTATPISLFRINNPDAVAGSKQNPVLSDAQRMQGWQLLGTLLTDQQQLALIQMGNQGRLAWVRAGETLDAGFVVVSILPQTLSLATKQGIKTLLLSDKDNKMSSVAPVPAQSTSLSALRQQVKQNPAVAMQWLKIDPKWQNGQLTGVSVTPQKGQEALFKQLGLQSGDVLLRLNGESMQVWMTKIASLPSVLDKSGAKVTVLRNGSEQEILLNW